MNRKDRSIRRKKRTAALMVSLSLLCLQAKGAAFTEILDESRNPAVESGQPADTSDHAVGFSLRTNLPRLATLTPDIGVEWRVSDDWAVLVDGSYTSWSWNDKERRYALWEVSPQVRRYLGSGKRGYVGAMFKAGSFNYKFGGTGRQGDIIGGGIVGGYRLSLGKAFALDFSLGLGCLWADYEDYEVVSGVRIYRGDGDRIWCGPTSAGVTLVWTVF